MNGQIKFRFTAQAIALVRQTRNFNMDEFIDYVRKTGVPVGSANVLEYLMIRDARERGPKKSPESQEVFVDA